MDSPNLKLTQRTWAQWKAIKAIKKKAARYEDTNNGFNWCWLEKYSPSRWGKEDICQLFVLGEKEPEGPKAGLKRIYECVLILFVSPSTEVDIRSVKHGMAAFLGSFKKWMCLNSEVNLKRHTTLTESDNQKCLTAPLQNCLIHIKSSPLPSMALYISKVEAVKVIMNQNQTETVFLVKISRMGFLLWFSSAQKFTKISALLKCIYDHRRFNSI